MHIPIPGCRKPGHTLPHSPSTPRTRKFPHKGLFYPHSYYFCQGMDMWLDIFLRGILIGLVVSMFSIGPVGVLCIQRTLSKGQRSGFFSGLGAATADTVYATVAFFRHRIRARLHRTEPVAAENHRRRVRRRGRPLYLFQNPVVQIRRNRSGKVSLWRDFLSIFLFTIANPAISLVFVGLFAMFGISNDAGYINGVAMLVGVLAGAAGWWFLFTFVLNIYRKRFRPRYLLWMNRIAGILIILLGVTAIISSLFNIHFDELIPK